MRFSNLLSRWLCLPVCLFVACSDSDAPRECTGRTCDRNENPSEREDEKDDSEESDDDDPPTSARDASSSRDAGTRRDAAMADSGSSRGSGVLDSGLSAARDAENATGDGSVEGDAGGGGTSAPTGQMLPPINDYNQRGPFKTTTTANTGPSNNYMIYRPEPLGENGFVHTPIIFGPGIATSAPGYKTLLDHLASHGFVTISVNSISGGPGAAGNLTAMKTGLDWILAQNSAAGVFQGKLAVKRAVAMGYSIGATASIELSSHEAIFTTVSIHGHNTKGAPHGPVLLMTGSVNELETARQILSGLDEAPAVIVALPIGHLDVLQELDISLLSSGAGISKDTRYIAPITAWLRYWVNGDEEAKRFFWGSGCEMCKSPWIPPEPNDKWKAQAL